MPNNSGGSEFRNEFGVNVEIHVDAYKSEDHDVFSVYRGNRNWKRLARRDGYKDPRWIERRVARPNEPAAEEDVIWLNNVWRNCEDYPRIQRFERGSDELWKNLPRFDPRYVPPTRWLIKSFLAERSIQLVFGERGSFKSTLLLGAAKAVANREEFLGLKTRQRRVLYLDYENPAATIKARNDDLRLEVYLNKNLKIWDRFGPEPTPRPDDPLLEGIVRECVAESGNGPWIIFDSFASLLKPGEGGEFTGQIAPTYICLRRLADLGATITMMDHTKKNDRNTLYGGQDKEAKADSIHSLSVFPNKVRPENSIVRVETWLKRAAPQGDGSFAFEVQSEKDRKGNWHIVGLVPAQDPEKAKSMAEIQLLHNLIQQNPNAGQEELARLAANEDIPRDQAIKLLKNGIGKYWEVRKNIHNKFSYSLLKK
jgi:AAA domain